MPSASTGHCDSQVTVYEEGDAEYDDVIEELFTETTFSPQCTGVSGAVNYRYAKNYMRPRAEVVGWIARRRCTSKGGCSCGFGLGFAKTELFEGEQIDVFYIDLVCSQARMGGKILTALEDYALENEYAVVALRAAVPKLVKYYQKKGYAKQANACFTPSRASRIILRGLNRFAAGVGGAREGVYTDGERVVASLDDAWRKAGLTRPRGRDLPPGWRYEEGYHGWWMSKCL
jgi:hypothetical protein